MGLACKVSLMDLQIEIYLNIHALNRKREQERIYLKEGSSLYPLRQGIIFSEQLQRYRERKTGLHIHTLKSIKNWRVN